MKHHKVLRRTTTVILLITGLNAIAAGYSFMKDPSGKGIGISTDYLRYAPFNDFLIPGIILFVVIGATSILIALVIIFRRINPLFICLQGSVFIGWIMIQVIMVRDFNLLHFIILSAGVTLLLTGRRLHLFSTSH